MKKSKNIFRTIVAFCLVIVIMAPMCIPASARASDYLALYYGSVSKEGNTVYVDFGVTGTRTWENIGALTIYVYKVNGTLVKVFRHETTPGMLGHNTGFQAGYVSFVGEANAHYKAYISVYAGPGDDGDNRWFWAYEE